MMSRGPAMSGILVGAAVFQFGLPTASAHLLEDDPRAFMDAAKKDDHVSGLKAVTGNFDDPLDNKGVMASVHRHDAGIPEMMAIPEMMRVDEDDAEAKNAPKSMASIASQAVVQAKSKADAKARMESTASRIKALDQVHAKAKVDAKAAAKLKGDASACRKRYKSAYDEWNMMTSKFSLKVASSNNTVDPEMWAWQTQKKGEVAERIRKECESMEGGGDKGPPSHDCACTGTTSIGGTCTLAGYHQLWCYVPPTAVCQNYVPSEFGSWSTDPCNTQKAEKDFPNCKDNVQFRNNHGGNGCAEWEMQSCYSRAGFSSNQLKEVRVNCPRTCGICQGKPFYMMPMGSCCCPEADRIGQMPDCTAALQSLGVSTSAQMKGNKREFIYSALGAFEDMPGGCSLGESSSGTGKKSYGYAWNTIQPGRARADYRPVCMSASTDKVPENIYRAATGVGGWGGSCTCPNGQVYQVGDNMDHCGSLACEGGIAGACEQTMNHMRGGMKVTCLPAEKVQETAVTCADGQRDNPHFKDEQGYSCPDWVGYSCKLHIGYTERQLFDVQGNCPMSCKLCEGSQSCDVTLLEEHSFESCSVANFGCSSPTSMYVVGGCGGTFVCNGEKIICNNDKFYTPDNCACPKPTNPPEDPFNCEAGFARWQDGWSAAKKVWCCDHKHMGCEDSAAAMSVVGVEQASSSGDEAEHSQSGKGKGKQVKTKGKGKAEPASATGTGDSADKQ